jgi:hypothetical protein
MKRYERFSELLMLLFLCATGCATKVPVQPAAAGQPALAPSRDARFAIRNQGYGLFYSLMSDEKNVSKLLLIKKEKSDLGDLIRDISRVSGEIAAQLEAFQKADPHVHLEFTGLPKAEQETRDLIGKTRAKELIGKGGEKFEVRILLTQSEALAYGTHLAVIVQNMETDAARKKFLGEASAKLGELHQRVINLFHARWREPVEK